MEEGAMAKELLPDALWARIAPLLPPEPPKPKGGRPRVSDRAALTRLTTSNSRERSAWTAAHGLCYIRDMTIKRLDHISVVVDDLAAAIAFFTALGMTLEGEMPVEGPWVDRVNGLESV